MAPGRIFEQSKYIPIAVVAAVWARYDLAAGTELPIEMERA